MCVGGGQESLHISTLVCAYLFFGPVSPETSILLSHVAIGVIETEQSKVACSVERGVQ